MPDGTDWNIASTVGIEGKTSWWERHHKVTRYGGVQGKTFDQIKTDFNKKDSQGRNVYSQDPTRVKNRKDAFLQGFYKQAKDWKGNEWMKKALDQAWDKNEFGVRAAYTQKNYAYTKMEGGGEGGAYEKQYYGGYGSWTEKQLNTMAHTYAAKAQEMYESDQRNKESERMLSERRARGGMGSRGSTLLTGGREGVLGAARTKKSTLIGAQEG